MKRVSVLLLIFFSLKGWSQEALHNFGNLKIHDNGAVGFHYDLVNDGTTDDNKGLVGFYNSESSIISGAFRPIFNDLEIMVANNLFLEVGVGVTNNSNFILGDVLTPRDNTDISLEYINNAFYNSDDDSRKIDGYAAFTNKQEFKFPIGNEDRLRSLQLNSLELISSAKSAYFFENPNTPSFSSTNFNTSDKAETLGSISTFEYWRLEASVSSWINLEWDTESQLSAYVQEISEVTVVGWHIERQQWENLGNVAANGDLNNGQITSDIFIPDEYEAITFGSNNANVDVSIKNYYISPNGDGINDFLVLEAIKVSPNNELKIYNRWGRLVYAQENYDNSFNGEANTGLILKKGRHLPAGVYFYVIDLKDLDTIGQGYFYITE